MPLPVSDSLSNANEQIEQAAKAIGRSKLHRTVFEAIYDGKQRIKTVGEIAKKTRLTRKQVLMSGKRFTSQHIVNQVKHDHDTAYEKIDFFHAHKRKILALAGDPKRLDALPTKRRVVVRQPTFVRLSTRGASAILITVDDIDSFSKIRKVRPYGNLPASVSETAFKEGVRAILAHPGERKDWGGEKNDLHTTRLRVGGKRRAAAFAFKGPGTKGKLVPKKMGHNGDQITRLFQSAAEVFVVQYWREIDESILDMMKPLAYAKSLADGHKVWYGVIDGQDSYRLYRAYSPCFAPSYAPGGRRRNRRL